MIASQILFFRIFFFQRIFSYCLVSSHSFCLPYKFLPLKRQILHLQLVTIWNKRHIRCVCDVNNDVVLLCSVCILYAIVGMLSLLSFLFILFCLESRQNNTQHRFNVYKTVVDASFVQLEKFSSMNERCNIRCSSRINKNNKNFGCDRNFNEQKSVFKWIFFLNK